MCGICGIIDPTESIEQRENLVRKMTDLIRHRGPDGQGIWSDESGVTLGHRRLSILDLSSAGDQPMTSHDCRWVVSYNGEIYNFQETRSELEQRGLSFVSDSDTEVLVNSIATFGLEVALQKAAGMFALAAWDKKERRLYLARDRFGQKPLFYGKLGSVFLFGSELRMARVVDPSPTLDEESVALMLRYKAVPAPKTIYRGLSKLRPGHWICYSTVDSKLHQEKPYWSLRPSLENRDVGDPQGEVKRLFEQAVGQRMISDVPLGAFLSGGIDSTLVVAAMQKQSSAPVRTFTIGFEDKEFDEATHASEVAKFLGTDHTELRLTPKDLLEVVPEMPRIYDEPFSDSSQVPTYLVSKLARRHVTVALSGDGGDEFFGGYNRHVWLPRIASLLRKFPRPVLEMLKYLLSSSQLRYLLTTLSGKGVLPVRMVDDKLDKIRDLLQAGNLQGMYRSVLSDWDDSHRLAGPATDEFIKLDQSLDPFHQVCMADVNFYLPDDILTKVDRASMAVSLEARSPFLDHRLAEYAMTIDPKWKVRGGKGKVLLRDLLATEVPSHLFERPKMGFAVPIAHWLRNDLRDWVEHLFSTHWVGQNSLLAETPIRRAWSQHLSGERNHHHKLWSVLMLLAWLEEND